MSLHITENHRSFIGKFLPLSLLLLALFLFPSSAHAETQVTDEMLSEMSARVAASFEAGKLSVDLSDMDIHINLYNDHFSSEYQKILDLCDELTEAYMSFTYGSDYREAYGSIGPQWDFTEEEDADGGEITGIPGLWIDVDDYYVTGDDTFNIEQIRKDQDKINREYQYALDLVTDDMTDLEKALVLHDYLVSLVDYPDNDGWYDDSETYSFESYQAVSVFRDHSAVCIAYATAYACLLNDCGVQAVTVTSDSMTHEWTMVRINGEWYHVDVTWDDSRYIDYTSNGDYNEDHWDIGAISHQYFLRSDEEMLELDHFDWYLDQDIAGAGITDTPTADQSWAFSEMLFGDASYWGNWTHFVPSHGKWYFAEFWSGLLCADSLDSNGENALMIWASEEEPVLSAYGVDDWIIFQTPSTVYGYDPETQDLRAIYLAEEQGTGSVISEMAYTSETLRLVLLVGDGDSSDDDPSEDEEYSDYRETVYLNIPRSSIAEIMTAVPETVAVTEPETTAAVTEAAETEVETHRSESAAYASEETEEQSGGRELLLLGLAMLLIIAVSVAVTMFLRRRSMKARKEEERRARRERRAQERKQALTETEDAES